MRKLIVLSIVLLMLVGFAITSSAAIELARVDLFAGQDIWVGELIVKVNNAGNLVVKYKVMDDGEWELLDTHLYVGTEPPAKSAPGRFPYGPDDAEEVTNGKRYVFDLPSDDFPVGLLYIAAQAEVQKPIVDGEGNPILDSGGSPTYQEETAWADGTQIRPGKNWAMYFTFILPEPNSE